MDSQDSIFLFGTGRSGTTLLLAMLACHPDLAWFSSLNERFPRWPVLSVLSRARDLDSISGESRGWKRIFPMPAEAIEVPRFATGGLFQSRSLLRKEDIDVEAVRRDRDYILSVRRWQGKKRLLHKHTGFARIEFLDQVDPGGRFVQIIRDGRAVAYSLLRVSWWSNDARSWWGEMPAEYEEEFERSGQDPLVLAGIVWKHLIDVVGQEADHVSPDRLLTLTYTDFVRQPQEHIERICRHCDLDLTPRYRTRINKFRIRDADEAWKSGLTADQVDQLNRSLEGHLERLGFEI